jgi:chemotaxis protein MotA
VSRGRGADAVELLGESMSGFIGIAVVFVMVFGGYMLAGGKIDIILYALPFEMMIIGGAAVGALVIGNSMSSAKHTVADIKKVFKGGHWKPQDYTDLLCLVFQLLRIQKTKPMDLDAHIENPSESAIFTAYPRILADEEAVALVCDTLRSMTLNYTDPHQVEAILEKRIEANKEEAQHSSHTLSVMADGLPALGIVAAVLGVIKTMASIDQPPAVLGKMIGSALVGTFLGVFLAYGIVGPFANRLKAVIDEEQTFYAIIREILVASLHGHSPDLCVEVGRQATPSHLRPSFGDLEAALRNSRQPSAAAAQPQAMAA